MSDQQQEQPKKRHLLRNVFFGFAAFIIVMTVFGALAGGDKTTVTASDEPEQSSDASSKDTGDKPAKPAKKKEAPGIGDKVRDGKFQFTVTKVKTGVRHVGDKDFGSDAQGEYAIVSVTVENIGDRAQTLDSSSQRGYDAKGREFSADGEAGISLDSKTFLEEVNPGNSVDARLVFDIPKGATLTRLELHDSAFSGGVDVDLR